MGYELREVTLHARLERHNSPADRADDAALERWEAEVRAMIDADPAYRRIFFPWDERVPAVEVPA